MNKIILSHIKRENDFRGFALLTNEPFEGHYLTKNQTELKSPVKFFQEEEQEGQEEPRLEPRKEFYPSEHIISLNFKSFKVYQKKKFLQRQVKINELSFDHSCEFNIMEGILMKFVSEGLWIFTDDTYGLDIIITNSKNGLFEGIFTFYQTTYEGRRFKSEEGYFIKGKLNGPYTCWRSGGEIRCQGEFKNGKKFGKWKGEFTEGEYDENGKATGFWRIEFRGTSELEEGHFLRGKKVGAWRYSVNNKVKRIEFYK